MRLNNRIGGSVLALLATVAFVMVGCSREQEKSEQAKNKDTGGSKKEEGHGWWCEEHGVPEYICSQCLSEDKVKKMFKDKGDWCKEHERAKSQCFKCDPTLYEKNFVPMYEAKFGAGKKPPRPPESEFKK